MRTPTVLNPSLRIALLVNPFTLKLKGGEHAPNLARELLGLGHTVRSFGAPPGTIPRSGAEPSVAGGTRPEGPLGFKPDVVVAYDGLSPAAWLGARVARRLDVPLVLVESGFADGGPILERFLRRAGETLWGRYVRHTAQRVVALDPVARDEALSDGFPDARVVILPTGVDLNMFRPGLSSQLVTSHRIQGRILLHAGRIEDNRGVETLVSAFAATVGQRRDWSLVLAGEGSARVRVRAMCDRLGIGDRVHWLQRPRREELPGLLGAATVLAVPALDNTVKGKQIPRALACGLPVIASDLPRLAFQVEDDGCGLLVPPGDFPAWTDALRRVGGQPMARKRWRARARELALDRFAWSHVARRFENELFAAREELAAATAERAPRTTEG